MSWSFWHYTVLLNSQNLAVGCFDNSHRVLKKRGCGDVFKLTNGSKKRQIYATQKATPPFALPQGRQAIINVWDFPREVWNLFTLWKSCPTHHRGLIRFRISDRKFVNHTTEMILWSMILVDACKIFDSIRWQHRNLFESRVSGKF